MKKQKDREHISAVPRNQPQMPNTHSRLCLWGRKHCSNNKQPRAHAFNRVSVCVFAYVCPVVSLVYAMAAPPTLIMSASFSVFLCCY